MSWPVVLFGAVIVVVVVGWVAYERSRPTARSIALVATLSALAALGRVAFAAFTEVKPITAMTFVVGYSLGPVPGFTVGAMGMLVSNMLFGQGPYTPWQMAGWGLVGLAGAVVGRLTRRRLGRIWLGVCCAAAAVMAKEVMDVYTWTVSAAHTASAFLVVQGSALPFDALDVGSTLVFGLAFGPRLVRLLARARSRMTVRWERVGAAGIVVAMALSALALAAGPVRFARAASTTRAEAIASVEKYLESAQASDGGFGVRPGAQASAMFTTWAAMGLAAGGRDPMAVTVGGRSPADALRGWAGGLKEIGDVERTMLALHACGLPAGSLAGHDLLARLMASRAKGGSFEGQVNVTEFAIFALLADGRDRSDPVVRAAGRWLVGQQNRDGSFSFAGRGQQGDIDDTGAAIQAIVGAGLDGDSGVGGRSRVRGRSGADGPGAGGRSGTDGRSGGSGRGTAGRRAVMRAISYLARVQHSDGGFPLEVGEPSNAQSTAWAVQGLVAAGKLRSFVSRTGRSPMRYLEGLVARDGRVAYARDSDQTPVWVTAQAAMALAEKPFPVSAPGRHPAIGSGSHPHVVPRGQSGSGRRRPLSPGSPGRRTTPRGAPSAGAGNAGADRRAALDRLRAVGGALGLLIGVALEPVAG